MIYLNGHFVPADQANIDCKDRGFLLSDGVFETIRVYKDKPFALHDHWERLSHGANTLELPLNMSLDDTEKTIQELIKINKIGGGSNFASHHHQRERK